MLLRQFQDFRGFYDREKWFWKDIVDVTLCCACAPPGGGRMVVTPRFFRAGLADDLGAGAGLTGLMASATGLGMIESLTQQLRGEAGDRQHPGARIGLQHNAGGMVGLDEALCAIHLLEAVH